MSTHPPTDNLAYFLAFCLEIYKTSHKLSGSEAADNLSRNGVLDYLANNYEVLHTQSSNWILSEIEDYIIKNYS